MIGVKFILLLYLMSISSAGMSEVENQNCEVKQNQNALNIINKVTGPKYNKHNNFECRGSGAWFYKIEQKNPDDSNGISANFKLPYFEHDPNRYFTNPKNVLPDHTKGPLDRASVYLGGEIAGTELDAGLSWDKVYDENGEPKTVPDFDEKGRIKTEIKIDQDGKPVMVMKRKEVFAFRPFWRTTEKLKSKTVWHNPNRYEESKAKEIKVKAENKLLEKMNEKKKAIYLKEKKEKEVREKIIKTACDSRQKEDKDDKSCNQKNVSFVDPGSPMSIKILEIGKFQDKKKYGNRSIVKMKITGEGKCFVTCFEHLGKPDVYKNSWKRVSSIDQFDLGPCYKAEDGSVTSDETEKKMENSKHGDCRPSRETQKADVLSTSAKLEHMNWESLTLLKPNRETTPLDSKNSKKVLGNEFCKKNSKYKGQENKKFIDLTNGIDESGGQSLNIIPNNH